VRSRAALGTAAAPEYSSTSNSLQRELPPLTAEREPALDGIVTGPTTEGVWATGGVTRDTNWGGNVLVDVGANVGVPSDGGGKRGTKGIEGTNGGNVSHNFGDRANTPFVFATGASSNHACWLITLLGALKQLFPDFPVVVYDLGLEGDLNITHLNMVHPKNLELRRFQYGNYPDFFRIDQEAGEYAWKPVIIKELADEFGKVLWLDSGNTINKRNNVTDILTALDTVGFYSPQSVGRLTDWTHPGMISYFKVPSEEQESWGGQDQTQNCNGAVVGFNRDTAAYHDILIPWAKCALDRNCIAPPGSDRNNHRQDQAALSLLVARRLGEVRCYPSCKTECNGISLHRDWTASALNMCKLMGMPLPVKEGGKKKRKKLQEAQAAAAAANIANGGKLTDVT
jgi:hypothetical protein